MYIQNSFIKLTALILLSLLTIISVALFLYSRLCEKPMPTVVGWSAAVVTIAGDGSIGLQDSVPAMQARFHNPFGIVVDRTGNVYVSDAGENNRIRKITPDNLVSTFAGGKEGFADGIGSAAAFNTPSALAIDAAGNLYVADTGNNRIRKITPTGLVTTLAGDGTAGYRDGPAGTAQFNGPVGIAVGEKGDIYVADTYNDRIRQITPDGMVQTLAGDGTPGLSDGPAPEALFDTPCAIAVAGNGELFIADTGNNLIRKLTNNKYVTTLAVTNLGDNEFGTLETPIGLTLTHDDFLYVTEEGRGKVWQISPDGTARIMAGAGSGFANVEGHNARFNHPTGIAVDKSGAVYIADSANYLIRKLVAVEKAKAIAQVESQDVLPHLAAETLGVSSMLWPVDPQQQWHEVVATMGEVRGSYAGESRDHLHSGIDIQGNYGMPVRAVYDEKVSSPLSNWGFGGLSEGIHVGSMTYIHLRLGRNAQDEPLDSAQFIVLRDEEGKVARVRIKRGTRFRVGDVLGTINRMYHVHLNFGPSGAEVNPLTLPFINFSDHVAPVIEHDGIQLFDPSGNRLTEKRNKRLLVHGDISIVVDAYDQVDHSLARRRLGLYKLGYQVLNLDGTPAPGFEQPRITIEFDRLPPDPNAVKVAYADSSGITVYGSAATRFLYVVTSTIRHGQAISGSWHTSELPSGDYLLRIIAADYAGNEARTGRDLPITIEQASNADR